MTTTYRIGKPNDRTVPAQVIAPLTCCVLSAFDRVDVPSRFSVLRDSLNDVEVRREEYISEVVRHLNCVPRMFTTESELIKEIAGTLKVTVCEAARMYVLAYLVPKEDAYFALKPKGGDRTTFMQVCAGIHNQRELARARVDLILQSLLRLELEDRCLVVCGTLDAPFWFERGSELVVVALTHYSAKFVLDFKSAIKPFVRDAERAHELSRMDFNVFAAALQRLPPTSEATARMEELIFGDAKHPEAGRVAWAFCSIWCVQALDAFRWNLSPEVLKRMWSLAKVGRAITVLEATKPFGST